MIPPAVILSQPQMGENVGAAARAMKNFGLSELVLIAPKCDWPSDRAQMLASGSGDILDAAKLYPTAAEALAPYQSGAGHHGAGPRCGQANPHPASGRPAAARRRCDRRPHRPAVRRRAGRPGQ